MSVRALKNLEFSMVKFPLEFDWICKVDFLGTEAIRRSSERINKRIKLQLFRGRASTLIQSVKRVVSRHFRIANSRSILTGFVT